MSSLDFKGKCVLVTGASRGIGRAVAQSFAAAGAKVAVHYCKTAPEETMAAMEGGGHVQLQADMADPEAVEGLVRAAVEQLGGLDILVNNAGVFLEHKVAEIDYEGWQQQWAATMAVNVFGVANACWAAAQHMRANGGGRIVNITSRGAFRGEPDAPAYGASKAAVNSMTQSLAKALGPDGIFVSAVAPGWVDTDMAAGHVEEGASQSPLGRVGRPEEIAHAVLYLSSAGAEFSTGAILDCNGASFFRN